MTPDQQHTFGPSGHCFREDNCTEHADHEGDGCCCCGEAAEAHTGCDCE